MRQGDNSETDYGGATKKEIAFSVPELKSKIVAENIIKDILKPLVVESTIRNVCIQESQRFASLDRNWF